MGIKLSQIASNESHLDIPFQSGTLSLDYAPLLITDETFSLFSDFTNANAGKTFSSVNRTLANVIKNWDLLEDDGETVIPLTPERLAQVSTIIKLVVVAAILRDIRPESMAPLVIQSN